MDARCQYASTHCPNMRSLKISGELHRFCLFHRRSANAAQRRWKLKKLAEAANSSDDEKTKRKQVTTTKSTRRRQTSAAASRMNDSIVPIAPAVPVVPTLTLSLPDATEEIPPLFSNEDMTLLSTLILGSDEVQETFSMPMSDCWWSDLSLQQDAGVIV